MIATMPLAGFGLVTLCHFLPPPSPNMTALDVAGLYQTNTGLKRMGFMLMMLAGGFQWSFTAALSVHMRRIEGPARMLTYTQLAVGSANGVLTLIPSLFFTVAAFRPDRNPDVTMALHDLAWITTTMPVASFMLQQFVIAMAVFADKATRPVFPRWVAYMNIWTALLYLPAFGETFFKTGPFAWNGLLAFWIAVAAFMGWTISMLVMLFKAIRSQEAEAVTALAR